MPLKIELPLILTKVKLLFLRELLLKLCRYYCYYEKLFLADSGSTRVRSSNYYSHPGNDPTKILATQLLIHSEY